MCECNHDFPLYRSREEEEVFLSIAFVLGTEIMYCAENKKRIT